MSLSAMWKSTIVVFLVLFANACHGSYLPGDELFVEINSLTSIDTQLPFSYYTFPYCEPQGGIKKSGMNLGQLLLGDEIRNSPYRFHMNVSETVFLCVKGPLTADEVALLKKRTRNRYQVNTILESNGMVWFPIGYTESNSIDDDYIYNHLSFRVFIREKDGIEIVGFEAVPYSVKHNPNDMTNLHMYDNIRPIDCPWGLEKSQIIQENESVVFTYEVEFVKSDHIMWPYEWNSSPEREYDEFRWLSIINSVITISILAVIVLVIYWRTIRRELKRFEKLDIEPQGLMSKEISGWKLLVCDVFREPGCAKLLCVMVGDGIQIIAMAFATIVLVVIGFMPLVSRGVLLTTLIMLYVFFGVGGGYASVRLWGTIKGTSEGWKSVSLSVACFFPGIVFIVLTFSNVLLYNTESTRTISISLFLILLSLWFCILVPLTLIGGFIGTKAEPIHYPLQTNHFPREIPARKRRSWVLVVLGVGYIPFGTFFLELFYILSEILLGRLYAAYGFLLVFFVLLVVACSLVSIILTYSRLRVEDWRWWWKAFFASGSTGIYVFLYLVKYLIFDLQGLRGPVSDVLYVGYSLIVAVAFMLATGTIGFLVSFYYVHYLYSSYKIT